MLASLLLAALTVTGTVSDIDGKPVAGATVSLRTIFANGTASRRAVTDAEGRFRMSAVQDGSHVLRAAANGFLRTEPLPVDANGGEVNVVLERGVLRTVRVYDAQGKAAAGARITCATDGFVRAIAEADAHGKAVIATPPGSVTLYAITPASFAVRRTSAADKDVRIDVPAAAASLEVATLTTTGEPLPNIGLLVRYNGELVPPELARELGQKAMRFRTRDDGRAKLAPLPRGTYELWPYRSEDEVEALMASASSAAAPATVNVLTGENKVTIRFRRR